MESIYCSATRMNGIISITGKRIFVMKPGLKSKIVGGALTIATVFGGVTANSNHAYATAPHENDIELVDGKDDPAAKGTDSETKLLPGKDLRGREYLYTDLASAKFSKNGVIVLYCGTDPAHFDTIRQGATDAREAGANIKGVVWGDTSPDVENGKEHFSVFAGGSIVRHPDVNMSGLRQNVEKQCNWASLTFGEYMVNAGNTQSSEVATIGNP